MAEPVPISEKILANAAKLNAFLDDILQPSKDAAVTRRPDRLLQAMRHGVLNGGKRLRPFLLMASARLFNRNGAGVMRAAAALECIHCYSLIHDDLPAMDDDDLRRGQPTVHRAFDEATAILAGDCLQTLAFELLADPATHGDGTIRCELVALLARASGASGMAGGQQLDLQAERTPLDSANMEIMQRMKTAALFRFASEGGAVIASANPSDRNALSRFGETIGLAFQLADDILDVTASTAQLGKRTAKDAERNKATLVAKSGLAAARERTENLLTAALEELTAVDADTSELAELARFMVHRGY